MRINRYHPITTTLQRQREHYLSRIGLRGFRTNIEQCRRERQSREPILERVTIDELIELDDLETPASTNSYRSRNCISNEQQRERTQSDTSSQFSFGRRSSKREH